ncbi:hypothetical protein C8F04DRAFT_1258621 [Mycena alexandri]|uniref:CCHC-type domain-containing protein n=1 Tax=Mycena alexandri TaxID=1745969 RepID=A0AAD6SZL5_9AGAR|nr:hypothetical protein C8F04DRAFT_1258621 [Mycena alexandri]
MHIKRRAKTQTRQQQAGSPRNPIKRAGQKLTKAEMSEYRVAGKCFDCGSTEHIRKDCPKRNTLKPPKNMLQSSAITFDEIERRHALAKGVELGVCCASIELAEPSLEHQIMVDAIHIIHICAGLLASLLPSMNRFEDFCVMVSEAQLLDSAFDFKAWYWAGEQLLGATDTHTLIPETIIHALGTNGKLEDPEREMEDESRALVSKGEVLVYSNKISDALSKPSADSELVRVNALPKTEKVRDKVQGVLVPNPDEFCTRNAFSLAHTPAPRLHICRRSVHAKLFGLFLDGLLCIVPRVTLHSKYLSDPTEDVHIATETLLADFVREIRDEFIAGNDGDSNYGDESALLR